MTLARFADFAAPPGAMGGLLTFALFVAAFVAPWDAAAGEASVLKASARYSLSYKGEDIYSVSATIAHADTGWKHYADKFEVLAPDGTVLGTRVLLHPHVDEQPFTRSLGNVVVPAGLTHVVVRASDNVHKAGKKTITVKLPRR